MKEWNILYRYITENRLISPGDHVVAGVSGGADSVCLILGLKALSESLSFQVEICHVHHGLRQKTADEDEMFVRDLAKRLDLPLCVYKEDVGAYARENKMSVEEAGRAVRRKAFEKAARGGLIATAHHMNDNAETMLMNLSRGSGLRGMCGLHPKQGQYIKPLLCMDKNQIESLLLCLGERWRTDETNGDDRYTRNLIRSRVIPVLSDRVNRRTVEHLFSASRQAIDVWKYMEKQADMLWEKHVLREGKNFCLTDRLFDEETVLVKMICKRAIGLVGGSEKDVQERHVEALAGLYARQSGRMIMLPYSVRAVRSRGGIILFSEEHPDMDMEDRKSVSVPVKIPGDTLLPDGRRLTCRIIEGGEISKSKSYIPQKGYTKWIDYDTIKAGLEIRCRRPGDRIVIDRSGRSKKLKKFFVDEKISSEYSRRLLLVTDGQEVVWVPGVRLSSRYYVGNGTGRILEMSFSAVDDGAQAHDVVGGQNDGRED